MLTGHDTGVDIECGSKLAMGNRMQLGRRKVLEPSATLVYPSGVPRIPHFLPFSAPFYLPCTFSECFSIVSCDYVLGKGYNLGDVSRLTFSECLSFWFFASQLALLT